MVFASLLLLLMGFDHQKLIKIEAPVSRICHSYIGGPIKQSTYTNYSQGKRDVAFFFFLSVAQFLAAPLTRPLLLIYLPMSGDFTLRALDIFTLISPTIFGMG